MLDKAEDRRQAILTASIDVFSRYGFKRCSMEDIAEAAGLSRPALYQYFKNKTDIFRAGSEAIQAVSIAETQAIADDPTPCPLAERLAAMLHAYKGTAWRVVHQTPHGQEMMDLNAALAEDVTQDAMTKARSIFAGVIAREAVSGWDAAMTARLLAAAAWSVMAQAEDEAAFRAEMQGLATIWAAAIKQPPA